MKTSIDYLVKLIESVSESIRLEAINNYEDNNFVLSFSCKTDKRLLSDVLERLSSFGITALKDFDRKELYKTKDDFYCVTNVSSRDRGFRYDFSIYFKEIKYNRFKSFFQQLLDFFR